MAPKKQSRDILCSLFSLEIENIEQNDLGAMVTPFSLVYTHLVLFGLLIFSSLFASIFLPAFIAQLKYSIYKLSSTVSQHNMWLGFSRGRHPP